MSSDQSSNANVVEQTRQQIRGLVGEISQLAKQEISPEEFYGEFLSRVVSALAAQGGAVWVLNSEGNLALQFQINLSNTGLRENSEGLQTHTKLLYKAMETEGGTLALPQSGFGEPTDGEVQPGNPTPFLLILSPITADREPVGVIEIFQRADASPASQRGFLHFLQQMCELAGDYLKTHQLRHFSDRQALWTRLENYTRMTHRSLDPKETAFTIANEGRRLIECDRVVVALARGKQCKITAVSGQDVFNKRANQIRLLAELSTAVVATGEPIWYSGDTSNMAPQVEDAIQEYVDEAHSKMVAVLPLVPEVVEAEQDIDNPPPPPEPLGAIIVEQIENSVIPSGFRQRVEIVSQHGAAAMSNALEHSDLFLMPVWKTLGKSRILWTPKNMPKTVSVLILALVLIVFLFTFPKDFKLEAKGVIQPIQKSDIFAPVEGEIAVVKVKHNQRVKKGELLVVMKSTQIDLQLEELSTNLREAEKEYRALEFAANKTPNDELRFGVLKEKITGLLRQREQQQELKSRLEVRSPCDGLVVTWDVEQLLINRPVQKGQTLLTVASVSSEWELELEMPESQMGYLVTQRLKIQQELQQKYRDAYLKKHPGTSQAAADKLIAKIPLENIASSLQKLQGKTADQAYDAGLSDDLPVEFILATDPGTKYLGRVTEIRKMAQVSQEEGSVVQLKVRIGTEEMSAKRYGAEVTANVICGKRSVGFCWLHEFFEFVEAKILF